MFNVYVYIFITIKQSIYSVQNMYYQHQQTNHENQNNRKRKIHIFCNIFNKTYVQ